MITINENTFKTEQEVLNYVNANLMDEENQFTSFNEALEYLQENNFIIIIEENKCQA